MEVSIKFRIGNPPLGPVFVCISSKGVRVQVSVKWRHAGDRSGRDCVLLSSVCVVVYNRNFGGYSYLTSHYSGVQTNSFLDNGIEVRKIVDLRDGGNLVPHKAGLRKLPLKLLRLGWLVEEVKERTGERVCYIVRTCQPSSPTGAQGPTTRVGREDG